jgi:hypothetical protein
VATFNNLDSSSCSSIQMALTHSAKKDCSDESSEDEDSVDVDDDEDCSDNSSEVGDNDVAGSSSKKLS